MGSSGQIHSQTTWLASKSQCQEMHTVRHGLTLFVLLSVSHPSTLIFKTFVRSSLGIVYLLDFGWMFVLVMRNLVISFLDFTH